MIRIPKAADAKKTATERDAEIYKGARSKYALTDGQDAEVMR